MKLFEEYFLRHQVNDVPMVHHCSQVGGIATLILQSEDADLWRNRWIIFKIKWIDDDHHPGFYGIQMNSPLHDGYFKGQMFSKWPIISKKWHEYEEFILNWSTEVKGLRPITGQKEVIMAAWEMFVFIYDGWFAKQPAEIKQMLFQTLDQENSLETRYSYYQDVAIFLSTHHPAIIKTWKYEVLGIMQTYAGWLARLIEKNYEPQKEGMF